MAVNKETRKRSKSREKFVDCSATNGAFISHPLYPRPRRGRARKTVRVRDEEEPCNTRVPSGQSRVPVLTNDSNCGLLPVNIPARAREELKSPDPWLRGL